ncbi:competence type IV pilus minor pilin ComGF [Brochothrix campestris]|uniref:Prepilin-type N-terminal cleavage/methylation domain-containing protein n=1 Tax=Brochothrix campestris FSL F6-1037 TaxID=1265861 RepID=W7CX13_9LIST|nr:competence type IV pilus minor pilin ComGF [Brochothrix campestris]EUJ40281.1 hypothetical protein BCAMP_05496 [Brochothrix campestris FSL F6-1037]
MKSGDGGPPKKRLRANGFTLIEVLVSLLILPLVMQLIVGITQSVMQVQERWLVRQTETDWHFMLIQLQRLGADLRTINTTPTKLGWYLNDGEALHFQLKNDKLMMTTAKGGNITLLYEVDTANSSFEARSQTTAWHIELKGRGYYYLETPAPS